MKTRIINRDYSIHYVENNDEYHALAQILESMNMSIVDKTPYSEIWQGPACCDIINNVLTAPTHAVDFRMMEG